MKKRILFSALLGLALQLSYAQKTTISNTANIERILNTLAADEMRGRSALVVADIEKAANFIAKEFKEIGLKPYAEQDYRQSFSVNKKSIVKESIHMDDRDLAPDEYLIVGDYPSKDPQDNANAKELKITADEDFSQRFREIVQKTPEQAIILVDKKHAALLARFKRMMGRDKLSFKDQPVNNPNKAKVFIVADTLKSGRKISQIRSEEEVPMFNVAAILPGKSKPNEYVIFSSHYDHIGILPAVGQDSIANGADDDASGTTAMIELARYYKKLDNNERTLIFVAFTGEELGMFGSKYFSNQIDPDQVVAMINIEMIGKDSKFGPNTLYITGYDASDLGKLMQENLKGSEFKFYPDPYTTQNLFYRSDNAVLAAKGVPAHTFSTSQMDKDEYYHTVKDEVSTLDIQNIKSSIEAIAKGAIGIVKGTQTPTRVEKLRE